MVVQHVQQDMPVGMHPKPRVSNCRVGWVLKTSTQVPLSTCVSAQGGPSPIWVRGSVVLLARQRLHMCSTGLNWGMHMVLQS